MTSREARGDDDRSGAERADVDERLARVAGALRALPLDEAIVAPLLLELELCRVLVAAEHVRLPDAGMDDDTPANDVGDPRLARALDALRRRLGARWTVAAMARIAGMSRAAFARLFAHAIGAPPQRHLATMRMHEAARLLVQSDEGLAAIAGQLGYASEFAFSRAFKRHAGVAPAIYRRAARQGRGAPPARPAPLASPTTRPPRAPPIVRAAA